MRKCSTEVDQGNYSAAPVTSSLDSLFFITGNWFPFSGTSLENVVCWSRAIINCKSHVYRFLLQLENWTLSLWQLPQFACLFACMLMMAELTSLKYLVKSLSKWSEIKFRWKNLLKMEEEERTAPPPDVPDGWQLTVLITYQVIWTERRRQRATNRFAFIRLAQSNES